MKNKILVVDDEKLMRISLKDELTNNGYDVTALSNAKEGMNALQSEKYSMVITDVRLPKMDGITFLKEIKRSHPDTIVIVITAYGTINNAVIAIQEGAFDYVTKPFSLDELTMKLEKALKHKRRVNENTCLKQQSIRQHGCDTLIGKSEAIKRVFEIINAVSKRDTTILIQGESGTGKEVIAGAIHYNSHRKEGPLIKVSCAALNKEILESELFGHEKGAFTGAIKTRRGRFELADGGTLFLDDIDDVPFEVQVKLLRVLQEREFERVGGEETIPVNVRVICATKKDLKKFIREGKFREDLYYRLNVITIHLPPLRERKEDIPFLSAHFIKKYAKQQNVPVDSLSSEALKFLMSYDWPGNVRELENVIEHSVSFCNSRVITLQNLPNILTESNQQTDFFPHNLSTYQSIDLQKFINTTEKNLLLWAYQKTNGNQKRMSEILQIPRSTLQNKLIRNQIGK